MCQQVSPNDSSSGLSDKICKYNTDYKNQDVYVDEEIQELEVGTSAESEKGRNNEKPRHLSDEEMKELDTSTSAETEEKYQ